MHGARAKQLMSRHSQPQAARSSISPSDLTIEDAFTYTSSLYFRGKMAYARRFAAPPTACGDEGIYVIAPGYGLVPPNWPLDKSRLETLSEVPVDPRVSAYRAPLERHARALIQRLTADTEVVLLGSLLPRKYLQTLWPIFDEILLVPKCFIGVGDMSRGALLLRAASSGQELDYVKCQTLSTASR
jgi:hypothetical protein